MKVLEIKDERYYRPDEVALILQVSERSVRNWINDPEIELPASRIGNKNRGFWRILGKELREWLADRKAKPWE